MFKVVACVAFCIALAWASSHSEAPGTAGGSPAADITDLYAFMSPEQGREDYVVFVLNTYPLQAPFGGPNYYSMSTNHFYNIHIDNDGDNVEDITLQFFGGQTAGGFQTEVRKQPRNKCNPFERNLADEDVRIRTGLTVPVKVHNGPDKHTRIPLKILGPVGINKRTGVPKTRFLNWRENYNVNWVRGQLKERNNDMSTVFRFARLGFRFRFFFYLTRQWTKPMDYIGTKSFGAPNDLNNQFYEDYAKWYQNFAFFPRCRRAGRIFVGQRKESFNIALGRIFDLVNMTPLEGKITQCSKRNDDLKDKNVLSFVVEIHKSCLGLKSHGMFGTWATVRELWHDGNTHVVGRQVSRLGNPLVNELVIGLRDKDTFSRSPPSADAQFVDYVTHPTLPALLQALFAGVVTAPKVPRNDLVQTFLFGLPGVNKFSDTPAEVMRLNTNIAAKKTGASPLGFVVDSVGFPNGRRLGDDVVDIALRVMNGFLCTLNINCTAADAPSGSLALTDGVPVTQDLFDDKFPFMKTPIPGVTDPVPCPDQFGPTNTMTFGNITDDNLEETWNMTDCRTPTAENQKECAATANATCTLDDSETCVAAANATTPAPTPAPPTPTTTTTTTTTTTGGTAAPTPSGSPRGSSASLLLLALCSLLSFAFASSMSRSQLFMLALVVLVLSASPALASSHSEAPGTAGHPSSDVTDLYAFASYETGRVNMTTILLNANPLQEPFAGPNYYTLSDDHVFEIHIDNDGDCVEDHTLQFMHGSRLAGTEEVDITVPGDTCFGDSLSATKTKKVRKGIELDIGGKKVAIPLKMAGSIKKDSIGALNFHEYYRLNYLAGAVSSNPTAVPIADTTGKTEFVKPFDYAGEKTFAPEGGKSSAEVYEEYARSYIYNIKLPNCAREGRVFVGQRKETFHVTLGKIFDLINMIPLPGFPESIQDLDSNNDLANYNIATMAVEIPSECIVEPGKPFGVWAAVRRLGHDGTKHVFGEQVSRLGNPLVNEVVIGLVDKDTYSRSHPKDDAQFADYVLYPSLPAIIDDLFRQGVGATANIAPLAPRKDLVTAFLTGLTGANKVGDGVCEMMRLNPWVAPKIAADQSNLGFLGDGVGYPNGRRLGDDSVDISLRAMMGALCHANPTAFICGDDNTQNTDADKKRVAPVGNVAFLDGSPQHGTQFDSIFPYATTPVPGAKTRSASFDEAPCA